MKSYRDDFPLAMLVILILFFVFAIIGLFGAVSNLDTQEHKACTVKQKDILTLHATSGHTPRVYTACGTFEVKDSLVNGSFNAADIYGELQVGKTYDMKTAGLRVPVFSWFPTVIEVNAK